MTEAGELPGAGAGGEAVLQDPCVAEAIAREIIEIGDGRVTYHLQQKKSYLWSDPEEWARARTIAYLVVERDYPASRMRTEVVVPRRTPSDYADIVVYSDDRCQTPFLVVENKAAARSEAERSQGIEQGFGNANSLRCPLMLYDEQSRSILFDVASHPSTEREKNRLGPRDVLPRQYGDVPTYRHIAGQPGDIEAVPSSTLESKIRRAHSIIWSGGRRDPLTAFDEWSKLLFAKVLDERRTATGKPRLFQIGTNETTAAVANRVHQLFAQGCREDPSLFPPGTRITLSERKIFDVVEAIQIISLVRSDIDSIGRAFENFFGSVFRGELGQYFTMRQLARFTVALLEVGHEDFVIDPTAGSGGFLLEALMQVWHRIEADFRGASVQERERLKYDFATNRVYGIEIHEILARICKINLLLHHDGHTNIEGDRSCLDTVFALPRLSPPAGKFSRVIGNPPFGDEVRRGDTDHLGTGSLEAFEIAKDRSKVKSEHIIVERCIELLEPGGRFGLVVPDGLLNNAGERSNCPQIRNLLARNGFLECIVSLPDYAFRKSGAQNKTSILFFRKFLVPERRSFEAAFDAALSNGATEADAIAAAFDGRDYWVFLAEANHIGYSPTGVLTDRNDLYRSSQGQLLESQADSILGEYRRCLEDPGRYSGSVQPDCMTIRFTELWGSHSSHRIDPKYFLFKREARRLVPGDWVQTPIGEVMKRRSRSVRPEESPDEMVTVMTIGQSGDIRSREAGKGRNPPEWRGAYFESSSSRWFAASAGDLVFSSIDLWKGCIAVVPEEFEGALVTSEFPIYEITDRQIEPEFLSCLLRSRYYQRAFRAITTGHSNRRRTQEADFESLEIAFPPSKDEQLRLIEGIVDARARHRSAAEHLRSELLSFSNLIDGRGDEELPEVDLTEEVD